MEYFTISSSFHQSDGKCYDTTTPHQPAVNKAVLSPLIITDEKFLFIIFISLGIICQGIAVFGSICNIINIVVFVKQGFSDSMNVCLFALAISDFFSLLFIIWSNACYALIYRNIDSPYITSDVQTASGMWPHLIFARMSGWITAFIGFERCLCVLVPLKVKTIFTLKKHVIAMVTIFVVNIGCGSLAYNSVGLDWRFYPEKNTTLIGLIYRMDEYKRRINDGIGYAINGIFMPVACFLSVIACSGLLVVKLKQQAVWRTTNSSATNRKGEQAPKNSDALISRKRKIAKMVVLISVIFIASFLPAVAIFIALYVEPHFNYDGQYKNLFLVTLSVSFIAEVINSSIKIFVYAAMSTKYRITFHIVFRLTKNEDRFH